MDRRRTTRRFALCLGSLLIAIAVAAPCDALRNEPTWAKQTKVQPDAQAGGWFINLGITGARGKLEPETPKQIEIAYIVADTPAAGVLEVGDIIVGTNGHPFQTAHKFGYGMDKFGYEGPLMDFGNALEESQGPKLNGKLTLDVRRSGKPRTITLKLPARYGQFGKNYPFDCAKTELIQTELCDYLVRRQREDGSWHGRPHINAFAALALLAEGRPADQPAVEKAMRFFASKTNDKIDYGGYDCWKNGLYGICLAEYYLATKEEWVLDELREINRWLVKAQFTEDYRKNKGRGGWGHRPTNRPEGNGYGPFCAVTAQCMAAWSLMAKCGIEIDRDRYRMAHEFLARGTNNIGYVWYADGNAGDDKYADFGRTGSSALAHAVNPFNDPAYAEYALRSARCIGSRYKTFPDTHGSPMLGLGWTGLGAAIDPASFRNLMDKHIWYFSLAHCPDGTFYYQPNRDNNAQDYAAAPRLSASAAIALVLSARHRKLHMMQVVTPTDEPPSREVNSKPDMR